MRATLVISLLLILTAACAGDGPKAVPEAADDSPISGTIGLVVANQGSGVVVVAVRAASAAARADVRAGDRINSCNGAPVTDERDFERRVLDSRPGSVIELEIARGAESRRVSLPVEEILTAVQA
jgi:S1-C subfamily serine protease